MADWITSRQKRPAELWRIGIDFRGDIEPGDTVASHDAKAFDEAGVDVTATFLGARTITGTTVKVLVKDGAADSNYTVLFEVTTVGGDKFQADVLVPVRA